MLTPQQTFLAKVSIVGGFGGLIFGYNSGIIGGILFDLDDQFHLSTTDRGLIVSLVSIGSMAGCFLGGYLSDTIGRWRTTLIQDMLYLLGSIILTFSVGKSSLFAGRLVVGVASAFSAVATVPYLNEIAPVHFRGRLSSMFELMIVFGALLGTLCSLIFAGTGYGWRLLFFIPCLLSIIQVVGMLSLPESPHWLVQQGKIAEAKRSLNVIYVRDEAEAQRSLDHIIQVDSTDAVLNQNQREQDDQQLVSRTKSHISIREEILKFKVSFVVIIILMILGQLTGSVVIRNYAPTIFKDAGFSRSASLLFNVVVSCVNAVVVCTSTWYVDKFGRKYLLCIGFMITALGMAVLVIGFLTTSQNSTSNKDVVTFLCGCILTSAGFVLGFGPIGWVLSSELFSTHIRGRALSLSTLVRNIFEFCTNFLFLVMIKKINDYGTFAVFFGFCLVSIVFVMFGLVETKEIEPEEILISLKQAPLWRACFSNKGYGSFPGDQSIHSPIQHKGSAQHYVDGSMYSPINQSHFEDRLPVS